MTDRADYMALAFQNHEKEHHGGVDVNPVPDECLDDVARRYNLITSALALNVDTLSDAISVAEQALKAAGISRLTAGESDWRGSLALAIAQAYIRIAMSETTKAKES